MHIVGSELGENLVRGAAKVLTADGLLALYGPFKYGGDFTTPSGTTNFDEWPKKARKRTEWHSGLRVGR